MAIRLTKREMAGRERVLAWLDGKPYAASSRSKPAVPELNATEVRQLYSPLDPQSTGQFFTPDEMAGQLYAAIETAGLILDGSILEPCAGLGALLAPLEGRLELTIRAFELDQTCAKIGERLVPWATWFQDTPFDHLADIEGRFDWVIANPPFGTKWGLYSAEQVCTSGATRSEHLFLELALRALKPGGYAAFIAPSTFLESGTKRFRQWFQENGTVVNGDGFPLDGDFALTKINVRLFLFERMGSAPAPVQETAAEPAAQIPVLAMPDLPAAEVDRNALKGILALLRPAVGKGSSIALRLTAEGIDLLASDNQRIDAYVKCPAAVSNPAEAPLFARIPAAIFTDLVAVLDPGPVSLTLAEGTLWVRSGACTNRITLESGSIPEDTQSRIVNGEHPIHLTGAQFAALSCTTEAADDDEAQPGLTSLMMTIEGTELKAAAADGFMMAQRRIPIPDARARRRAFPNAEMLAKAAARISKAESIAVYVQENGLMVHALELGLYYHFWNTAIGFPNLDEVLLKYASNSPTIPIDAKRWANFLRRTRTLQGAVVLANLGAQLYAQVSSGKVGSTEDVLADYPPEAERAWVAVSWSLLRSVIEIVQKAENVTFQFGNDQSTPVWVQADGLDILLMPLHIGGTPELVERQQSGAIPLFLPQREEVSV